MSLTPAHELALLWLRDDPSRLRALLDLTGHPPWPAALAVEDSALRAAFPVQVTPDMVLREVTSNAAPRWMLVEVQRKRDPDKARRWPLAMAAMADRYGPDGQLVVITASRAVARWAARVAVHDAGRTRWGVRPTVLLIGRAEVERLLAEAPPELATFAAWGVQGRRGAQALDVARRALHRVALIDDERLRRVTQEGILGVLHPSLVEKVRSAMIDLSQLPTNPALERWKADLRAEGAIEGEARGEARMLVRILRGRGFIVGAEVEARVLATDSVDALERWADRALTAASIDEVFA